MAGYNKNTTYQDGDVIRSADTLNEFSSLDSAFDETAGHTHSGASGEGAAIPAASIVNVPSAGIIETDTQGATDNLGGRMNTTETTLGTQDGRLTVNEGDIAALEAANIVSDARITVNEGDIDDLEAADIVSDGRITVNEGDITSLETGKKDGFTENTGFNKNFGSASDTVCVGDDSRLSDARAPTSHTHPTSEVTGLDTKLTSLGVGPTHQIFTTPGGATWTKPSGCVRIMVECIGAGGGGGGAAAVSGETAGGGGGGGYSRSIIDVSASGPSKAITIGAGGAGGASGGNNGVSGGFTDFDLSAVRSNGGLNGKHAGDSGGSGGAGGAVNTGDIATAGDSGDSALQGLQSGAGGNSYLGGGAPGRGGNTVGAGSGAVTQGGGGSGARSNGTAFAGGGGQDGIIIVTEYYA